MQSANTWFITLYNLELSRLPEIHDQQSLTLHWRSHPGYGRARVSGCFDHRGGQYIENNPCCTNDNISGLTVAYLNAMIHSETRNATPDIGIDGSSETRQNTRVDRYGSRFGQPRGSRSGYWKGLEPKRPVCEVQTRTAGWLPGLVANTTSMWSTSSSINPLAQLQIRHKIQWSMLRKRTFRHFWWAHMGNRQTAPQDDVIKQMKPRAAWRQSGSHRWERCADHKLQSSFRWRKDKMLTY